MFLRRGRVGGRAGPARVALASVSVFAAGLVASSAGGPRSPQGGSGHAGVVVTVDVAHPGAALPTDFLGLSFEASVLGSDLFDPARSNLAALMRDLGSGRLRFGGDSVDRVAAWTAEAAAPLLPWAHSRVTPADLARLGALAAATGWKVDLGLTLRHPDPAGAAEEAAAAQRLIGQGLGRPSLAATSGVSLGGADVGADGTWEPLTDTLLADSADGVHIHTPAATAALVTVEVGSSRP
jgi:hypothetical protein